jgi:hypothetical protein
VKRFSLFDIFSKASIDSVEGKFLYQPCENSDRLVIYFSSASATHLEGYKSLQDFKVNKLLIRDDARSWYNGKIAGLSSDADDLVKKISTISRRFKSSNITTAGSSMGGYAALLFGMLIKAGRIVAIAPQTKLYPGIPYSPKFPVNYCNLLPLLQKAPHTPKIDIWFGTESILDLYHILDCAEIPNTTLHPLKGSMHDIFPLLRRNNPDENFFSYIVENKPFPPQSASAHQFY